MVSFIEFCDVSKDVGGGRSGSELGDSWRRIDTGRASLRELVGLLCGADMYVCVWTTVSVYDYNSDWPCGANYKSTPPPALPPVTSQIQWLTALGRLTLLVSTKTFGIVSSTACATTTRGPSSSSPPPPPSRRSVPIKSAVPNYARRQ